MKRVLITQRVMPDCSGGERRDALDQNWHRFLASCGLQGVPVPNVAAGAEAFAEAAGAAGIILTGGNDLVAYGGDAPERDDTERLLVRWAERRHLPILGVCRGMQFLLHEAGVPLIRVSGHVAVRHAVNGPGGAFDVNSFHNWAAVGETKGFEISASAADGVVECIRARGRRVLGLMWHPERESSPGANDLRLVAEHFGA